MGNQTVDGPHWLQ